MAKRISVAKVNQAINRYNQAVRKHNNAVNKYISDYNAAVRKHNQQVKSSVNTYNREVRRFNAAQEQKRVKLNQAIRAFNNSKYTVRTATTYFYRESVETLERNYSSLNDFNESNSYYSEANQKLFEDYPTQETDNSVQLYNSLYGVDVGDYIEPSELQKSYIASKLAELSPDISNRWEGALFSLNPNNPDAGRHFCTSVREVFTQVIDIKAPDYLVESYFTHCEMHQGKPNRRFKIKYILSQRSIQSEQLEKFVDSDVEDLLSLFRTLNDGTHGNAGKFDIQQLLKLKKRVEDSIDFITNL